MELNKRKDFRTRAKLRISARKHEGNDTLDKAKLVPFIIDI
jgi:hypothetical protein